MKSIMAIENLMISLGEETDEEMEYYLESD